jgi:hypothetical protein
VALKPADPEHVETVIANAVAHHASRVSRQHERTHLEGYFRDQLKREQRWRCDMPLKRVDGWPLYRLVPTRLTVPL